MELDQIDLADGRSFVDHVPHEWFRVLRREAPVWWHPAAGAPRGGFWCVTRYEDCVRVNRDWERFSSWRGSAIYQDLTEAELAQQRLMLLNMDPPTHTRYRRLVNKGFTPRMVRDLHDRIVDHADAILDAVCEAGSCDFVEQISAELPLLVIADILGIPQQDRRQVFDWSNRLVGGEDPEYHVSEAAAAEAAMQVYAYADELSARKRAEPGSPDLLRVLAEAEVDGERLDQMEIDLFFLLLIVAGNETTRNLMSGAVDAFSAHPEQWARLAADRSLLPGAIEEMLRFVTPVMHFRRTATADCELGGQSIREGDKVVFWHVSANRDETVFSAPDRFDIGRDPNPHMTFGAGGPHFCLGAHLARLEIAVMFERLLERMPDLHVDGPAERLQSNFVNGIKHLPVAFTPSAR